MPLISLSVNELQDAALPVPEPLSNRKSGALMQSAQDILARPEVGNQRVRVCLPVALTLLHHCCTDRNPHCRRASH